MPRRSMQTAILYGTPPKLWRNNGTPSLQGGGCLPFPERYRPTSTPVSYTHLEKAVKKFLEEIQKSQKPKIYRGRQSLKQLASQNAGLANIEISDKNIKAFSHVAKKYHVDFALKKDTAAEQPRYLVFFKSRDADAITAAFRSLPAAK